MEVKSKNDLYVEIEQREKNGDVIYPHVFRTTKTINEFIKNYDKLMENGETLDDFIEGISGRVINIRASGKKLYFIDIMSEGIVLQVLGNMMVYGRQENFSVDFGKIKRGDIIGTIGHPHRSRVGQLSILPKCIEILAPCLRMLPTTKNDLIDKEIRYRHRYIDLICNIKQMDIYRIRSKVINYLRAYLLENNFMEVETPMMVNIHGGASAKPFKTFHNDLGMELYMRIAPELYLKRLIVGGYERVFEIGKQFRNESIDLTHNPEFTTCEFYWAYKDYEDLMRFTERLLSNMVNELFGRYEVNCVMENGETHTISYKPPFRRIDMITGLEEALGEEIPYPYDGEEANEFLSVQCNKHGVECGKPRTNVRLMDKLVGHFLESSSVQPTFIINHPEMMSPLAKTHRSRKGLTERFELFIGTHELCNAYTELNDPRIQRERFMDQIKQKNNGDLEAQPFDEEFCEALEYGMPPTAGWGIGLDRLVMFLSGNMNIKEVILFPAMRSIDRGKKI